MQRLRLGPLLPLAILLSYPIVLNSQSLDPSNKGNNPRQQPVQHHQEQHQYQQQQQERQINDDLLARVESHLRPLLSQIDSELFVTQLGGASEIYNSGDLLAALPVVNDGIAGSRFYLGEEGVDLGWEYGLVNLAAFLAQCMKETIQYDACDENNWDVVNNVYPLANACGQLGQSYQDYACPPGEEHMQCNVDPGMRIEATTHAKWYGAPPGLFCAPRADYPWVGIWDYNYWCNNPWGNPPEVCSDYDGQKAGRFDNSVSVASRGGRTDVEGCCWWGRGVIQTTGLCNFGKLNYYLGARAAAEGRDAKYPNIDFCKTPDKICSSDEHTELKWIAGFFYWMKDVQNYNDDGWYYETELHKFVNSGMKDDSFIDAISGIVNRGCHNPPCATGEVDGLLDRRANFHKVLAVFKLPSSSARPPSTLPPVPVPSSMSLPSLPFNTGDPALLSDLNGFLQSLNSHRSTLEKNILSYQSLEGAMVLSDIYTFDSLIESVAHAHVYGHAGNKFYIGPAKISNIEDDQSTADLRYGLVNIAAFLALSQTESISNNACDEYHMDSIDGKFPISNSCGQFGNNYQDYTCSDMAEKAMECPVSPDMDVTAVSSGRYASNPNYGHRPNFYCGPGEWFTGAYHPDLMFLQEGPFANRAGRTNVKSCCFWGRGALMTKGVCMLGKLNHHLGAGAARDGRASIFPDIDFCANPGDICSKIRKYPTIIWDIAFFEWIERIQTYDDGDFNYIKRLHEFADGGMSDFTFIIKVSKILKEPANARGTISFSDQKRSQLYFEHLLEYLQLKDAPPSLDSLFRRNSSPRQQTTGHSLW
eukprot:CAMPEP_0181125170 /NCGR_PEP_ID=MMETSP1071-20121207/26891_1 /TAXON_ID=35127 /ORGANISM="Thalassiosira sp., Strain NH16" /LENGTH=815 /DNA_ID=CAMNT_0023210563 /DNA_START=54 /DNA_END=2498 /DNA_ORIENTATION=-